MDWYLRILQIVPPVYFEYFLDTYHVLLHLGHVVEGVQSLEVERRSANPESRILVAERSTIQFEKDSVFGIKASVDRER